MKTYQEQKDKVKTQILEMLNEQDLKPLDFRSKEDLKSWVVDVTHYDRADCQPNSLELQLEDEAIEELYKVA